MAWCGRYSKKRMTRRQALAETAGGLGGLALAWVLQQEGLLASQKGKQPYDTRPRPPHFPAKAKSVISLFMSGGPSQMDLFDPKPMLSKYDGQEIPMKIHQRKLDGPTTLMGSPFQFSKHGESGIELSEVLPHLAHLVDDIAVLRSVTTDRIDHDTAQMMYQSGRNTPGFPTVGSWVSYGLGTENQDLPAYITMVDSRPIIGARAWDAGWLPPTYQSTTMNATRTPIFDVVRPKSVSERQQENFLRLVQEYNRIHLQKHPLEMDLEARISNYELAARMQVAAMEQVDISRESSETKRMYGLENEETREYGTRCLLARRLVESGVRFVTIVNGEWDHHSGLTKSLRRVCHRTDQPIAALMNDLKQRGLWDSTLIVWGGEFGRQPVVEKGDGRDHNPYGFSLWMAGGGVKGGTVVGATDDFGYAAMENKLTVSDVHATILHLLGLDFEKLNYEYEGREETLVGVNRARVIHEIVA